MKKLLNPKYHNKDLELEYIVEINGILRKVYCAFLYL